MYGSPKLGVVLGGYLSDTLGGSTLSNGLVNYWTLNEVSGDRADSVGGITLAESGGTYDSTTGIHGNCATSPTQDRKLVQKTGTYSLPTAFTVSCWLKADANNGGDQIIIEVATSDELHTDFYAELQIQNVRFLTYMNDGLTSVNFALPGGFDFTVWNNVVFTYNGTTLSAYLNGVSIGTPTVIAHSTNVGFFIRMFADVVNNSVQVYQDETGIWNRALTQNEITLLYNSGTGTFYPF